MTRIILPQAEVCLAAGNSTDDIPLRYLAGEGNQLIGASITKKASLKTPDVDVYEIGEGAYVVDQQRQVEQVLEGMLLNISVEACHNEDNERENRHRCRFSLCPISEYFKKRKICFVCILDNHNKYASDMTNIFNHIE